ncbi:hypothetical protein [Nocardiopsis sp. LOL_012]|uniref:hypothetical protein n=1 Tax=Nocardiopsis sp. LOL_012 TaxID=3345409 RepID=UPI003A8B0AF3
MTILYLYLSAGAVTALLFHLEAERTLGREPEPGCRPCRDNHAFFARIVGDMPIVTPGMWAVPLAVAAAVWPLSVFTVLAPACHRPFCKIGRTSDR